jgi:hypothetical protein
MAGIKRDKRCIPCRHSICEYQKCQQCGSYICNHSLVSCVCRGDKGCCWGKWCIDCPPVPVCSCGLHKGWSLSCIPRVRCRACQKDAFVCESIKCKDCDRSFCGDDNPRCCPDKDGRCHACVLTRCIQSSTAVALASILIETKEFPRGVNVIIANYSLVCEETSKCQRGGCIDNDVKLVVCKDCKKSISTLHWVYYNACDNCGITTCCSNDSHMCPDGCVCKNAKLCVSCHRSLTGKPKKRKPGSIEEEEPAKKTPYIQTTIPVTVVNE